MNKLQQRWMSVILALGIFCSLMVLPVSAQTNLTDEEQTATMQLLFDLGLTDKKEAESTFTRRELAEILVKTMGYTPDAPCDTAFYDVKSDDDKSGAVQTAANLKIINGYSDGFFRPYDEVTYYQAIKTLLCMTGYEIFAEIQGGFPQGYLAAARRTDLMNGISFTDGEAKIPFGEFALMLKKALNIEMLDVIGADTENGMIYDNNSGRTLLKDYLKLETKTGKITETSFTGLAGASTLGENEVCINKTAYPTTLDLTDDIGKKFVFYIKKSESGVGTVIAKENGDFKNKTVEISQKDIASVTTNEILFYRENGNRSLMRFDANTDLIYNGKVKTSWGKNEFYQNPQGKPSDNAEIRLVDVEGDGVCDVVFVDHYTDRVVDTVNATEEILYLKDNVDGKSIDLSDHDTQWRLVDAEGNALLLSDLYEFCIISVAKSADGKLYRMRASNEFLNGVVSQIFEEYVVIDGKQCLITTACKALIKLQQRGVFYFNSKGEIAAVDYDASDDLKYAYLISMASTGNLSANILLKVFTQDGEHKVLQVANRVARNNGTVKEKELENDSALCGGGVTIPQLIRYRTDDNDAVCELYTAKDLTALEASGEMNLHASYDQIRYRGANMKTFASRYVLDDNTFVFEIPSDLSNENRFAVYKNNYMVDDRQCYHVKVYDVDADEKIGAIQMDAQDNGMVTYNSNVGIINEVWTERNVEREMITKLSLNVYGKKVELTPDDEELKIIFNANTITDLARDSEAVGGLAPGDIKVSKLQPGDVIQYATNSQDKLIEAQLFMRGKTAVSGEYAPNFSTYQDVYNATYYCYGEVVKEIDNGLMLKVQSGGNTYERVLPCYSATTFLAYDTVKGTCTAISLKDIYPGEEVFLHARLSNVTTVIVYR